MFPLSTLNIVYLHNVTPAVRMVTKHVWYRARDNNKKEGFHHAKLDLAVPYFLDLWFRWAQLHTGLCYSRFAGEALVQMTRKAECVMICAKNYQNPSFVHMGSSKRRQVDQVTRGMMLSSQEAPMFLDGHLHMASVRSS